MSMKTINLPTPALTASIAPDGSRIAFGSYGKIILYSPHNESKRTVRLGEVVITSLAWSEDSSKLIACSNQIPSRAYVIWGKSGEVFENTIPQRAVQCLTTASASPTLIAAATHEHEIQIWKLEKQRVERGPLTQSEKYFISWAGFEPGGKLLWTGSRSGVLHCYNTSKGELVSPPLDCDITQYGSMSGAKFLGIASGGNALLVGVVCWSKGQHYSAVNHKLHLWQKSKNDAWGLEEVFSLPYPLVALATHPEHSDALLLLSNGSICCLDTSKKNTCITQLDQSEKYKKLLSTTTMSISRNGKLVVLSDCSFNAHLIAL